MTENVATENGDGFLIPEVGKDLADQREEGRKRSLANLRMFAPGESGNPAGRKQGGAYVEEWINAFLIGSPGEEGRYTIADIKLIAESDESPVAAKIAAVRIMSAMRDPTKYGQDADTGEFFPIGTDSEPGKDFDRIMDRLAGKPAQDIRVQATIDRPASEVQSELVALLASTPQLIAVIAAQPQLREALGPLIVADSPPPDEPE